MAAKKDDKPETTATCPACGGAKTVAFGPGDVPCGTCNGKGTVKA